MNAHVCRLFGLVVKGLIFVYSFCWLIQKKTEQTIKKAFIICVWGKGTKNKTVIDGCFLRLLYDYEQAKD